MMRLVAVLTSVGLAMLVALPAEASLITNGSFEDPAGTSIDSYMTLHANVPSEATAITGWEVTANSIDWIGTYWKASQGSRSLDMSGFWQAGTVLSTKFLTTLGAWYRVQFDMAGNTDGPPTVKNLQLTVESGDDTSGTFSFNTAGKSHTNMGWTTMSMWFQAGAVNSKLEFMSLDGPSAFGPALDNVRVDAVAGNESNDVIVPEPAAFAVWSLIGFGVAGLALIRRGRRL